MKNKKLHRLLCKLGLHKFSILEVHETKDSRNIVAERCVYCNTLRVGKSYSEVFIVIPVPIQHRTVYWRLEGLAEETRKTLAEKQPEGDKEE